MSEMPKVSAKKGMVLHLRGHGNPDFRQYADVAPKKDVPVKSFEEAQRIAAEYQAEYDLGGGNWNAWITEGKKKVAHISYNLRVWTPEEDWRKQKAILERPANLKWPM